MKITNTNKIEYRYRNGIHHFYDSDNEFANGGWDGEVYSLHVNKFPEYRFKKEGDYITIVDNQVNHWYDGKLHGMDTTTETTIYDYENYIEEEKDTYDKRYDIPIEVIRIKKLLDEGLIW